MGLAKWIEDNLWKTGLIASIIISWFAFIVHAKFNNPINFTEYFLWLPLLWFMVFMICLTVEFVNWWRGNK